MFMNLSFSLNDLTIFWNWFFVKFDKILLHKKWRVGYDFQMRARALNGQLKKFRWNAKILRILIVEMKRPVSVKTIILEMI